MAKGENVEAGGARLSVATVSELKVAQRERGTRLVRGHGDCPCRFKASIKCALIRRGRLLARHCQPRRHSRARRGRAFTRVIFREYYATTFLLGPLGSPAKECGVRRRGGVMGEGQLLVTSGMLVIDSSCDRHRNRSSERAMRDLSRIFRYMRTHSVD